MDGISISARGKNGTDIYSGGGAVGRTGLAVIHYSLTALSRSGSLTTIDPSHLQFGLSPQTYAGVVRCETYGRRNAPSPYAMRRAAHGKARARHSLHPGCPERHPGYSRSVRSGRPH